MKQSPIFSKTYDFVKWLLPLTVGFPRRQRFVIAAALQQDALNFQGLLIEAVHQPDPLPKLEAADAELDKLRTHLRLCHDLQLISGGQYEQAAKNLSEIGRLLGGWKKSLDKVE
jgi:four helix bundle protein